MEFSTVSASRMGAQNNESGKAKLKISYLHCACNEIFSHSARPSSASARASHTYPAAGGFYLNMIIFQQLPVVCL
ncbi:hypothetical protein [Serratia entomophila]|jgi:hypothetical protein|uniref:hypothetical protein n=1 Tax=Serratia entomophila TaxID=42906 RepID=UPI0021BA8041|nr:hypothetical protein [Serratia entomophila]